jgi:xanthine dehydrogenase accessory factor
MWSDILDQANRLRAEAQPFVIATVVAFKSPQSARPGSKAIIKADGSVIGWIGGGCVQPIVIREAHKALQTGKPKLVSICPEHPRDDWKGIESYEMTCQGGGALEIFLEPVLPKPELLILGRSPVSQILSELGRLLDFWVCVADPEAMPSQFPEAHVVLTDLSSAQGRSNENSFVVVATMGIGDEEALEAVIRTRPRYIGLVASREKARSLFQYLRNKGITDEQLDRVQSPAGLRLGGETIPEIALSVMAEITQLRREQAAKPKPANKNVALQVMQDIDLVEAPSIGSDEVRDPICGMMVEIQSARYKSVLQDQTFYFCCRRCQEMFDLSPQSYRTLSKASDV